MATGTERSKKARLSQPQVRITTPDETLLRYNVELFNPATGKAKDALFEEINFDLYKSKAKSIAFTTSEDRISLWIRCFIERYYKQQEYEGLRTTWEEQDASGNADLCDRIIMHLYDTEGTKEQHLVAITVYVSTGTIFIQGKCYQQYGIVEFPLLLEIINKMNGLSNPDDFEQSFSSSLSNSMKQFAHPVVYVTDGEEKHGKVEEEKECEAGVLTEEVDNAGITPETNRATEFYKTPQKDNAEFCKSLTHDIESVETPPLTYTPSRLNTLTTLRNSVANIESDFASFKMDIIQTVQLLQSTVATNDCETKDKFNQSDNNSKLRTKKLEDENKELLNSNEKLTNEVSSLSSAVKKLQDQINLMRKKSTNLEEQHQILKQDHEMVKIELETLKQCQCQPKPDQTPAQQSALADHQTTSPHMMTESVMNLSSPVPLNNRFEVLQDVDDESMQMGKTPESATQQKETKNRQQKPETETTGNNTTNKPQRNNEKATVILCDSNGKYLNLKKLCPNKKTTYFRCPTVNRGNEIIESLPFDSPEIILIHTGTNDLERTNSAEHLASEISGLISSTAKRYPSTKVLYSTLLPRRDVPSEEISKINSLIEKRCSHLANVHLIDHTNLHLSQLIILHDLKHLNQAGVKIFAKNLKNMIYGRRTTTLHRTGIRQINSFQGNNRPQQETGLRVTHRTQEHTQVPTYAAVVQRPTTPVKVPAVQPPPTFDIQQQMEQGHTMNISIPKKIFPLIQLLNSLV